MPFVCRFLPGVCVLFWIAMAPAQAAGSLRVFVSIEPLRYLAERVGGERVGVTVVAKSGRPETYEPSPRQIADLAEADVFFGVGMPLEAAWRTQIRGVAAQSPQWVDLSAGIENGTDSEEPSGETSPSHDHGAADPHVWLSPLNARRMAASVREILSGLDPAGAAYYERNASTLHRELEMLDREISAILNASGVTVFLVFHPAWGHFARAYGLEQIAIESEGKEPGPRAMIEVIRRAKQAGTGTVFIDPRHAKRPAETIAQAIGARIETLDPLSGDYVNNLRNAARAIADSEQ